MSTRDRIIDAADQVMRSKGLARATTKEIARAAGLSEAALYKHFDGKSSLFVAVLAERTPGRLAEVLAEAGGRAGREPVDRVLVDIAEAALDFYRHTFPTAASIFAEPTLLQAHRASLREQGAGPQAVVAATAGYLEREATRLRPGTDPHAAASLLIGACLNAAFLSSWAGADAAPARNEAQDLVSTLMAGIAPARPAERA